MTIPSIPARLERARLILSAATSNVELQDRLIQLGYDSNALQSGQHLYEECLAIRAATHSARGDKRGSTATANELQERVNRQYVTLSRIARTIFNHDIDAKQTLGLHLKRRVGGLSTSAEELAPDAPTTLPKRIRKQGSNSRTAFLDRARVLYNNALTHPEILAELEKVGYPRTRLERERADLLALETADATQEQHKATSKATTTEQRARLAELQAWVARFTGIVVPALHDRPDLLQMMSLGKKSR